LTASDGKVISAALETPRAGVDIKALRKIDRIMRAIEDAELSEEPTEIELDDDWFLFIRQQMQSYNMWNTATEWRRKVLNLAGKLEI